MEQFVYANMEDEINHRIEKTGKLFNIMKTQFFAKKELPKKAKIEMVSKLVKLGLRSKDT